MITRTIIQNLDWIDNNPDSNPVVNETTKIVTRVLGIPVFTKSLVVTHTGKYELQGPPSSQTATVRGFNKQQ